MAGRRGRNKERDGKEEENKGGEGGKEEKGDKGRGSSAPIEIFKVGAYARNHTLLQPIAISVFMAFGTVY